MPDNLGVKTLDEKYKRRRKLALYKLFASIAALVVFFYLAWLLPRSVPRGLFSGLAGVAIVFLFFEISSILQNSWRILRHGKSFPKHIYEVGSGLAFFEEKDMKMCEEMAVNGYLLDSVTAWGFYKFERALPGELSYSVDFSDIKKEAENFPDYLEIFESAGWSYVCSLGTFHWFRAPKDTVPIYTDSKSLALKYEKMRRLSVWCVVSGTLVAIVFFSLSRVFPYPVVTLMFLGAMGLGLGLALAMSVGVVLNHRLINRLKRLQNDRM